MTVLGDPSLSEDAARAGAAFVPWREAPHRTTRTPESEIVKDWDAATPLAAFARARDRHAFRPAYLFAREVRALFDARPFDVVVVDAMLFGGLAGAEATGAPFAAIIPMTSFLPAPGRPPPSLGLLPAKGALGRARDRALFALGDAVLWRSCVPFMNHARAEVGLGPIAHPLDQIRRADRVLVQTSPWFDFDAPPSFDNVRYVGPEIADPSWAAPFVSPWPKEDRRPLVLVAFSTTYMGHEDVLGRVARALGSFDVRGLVTTGPALDPARIEAPPNVAVLRSAPHGALLPDAALVVTHAGHGTAVRALAHGVPVLAMPMGRDQADNAARIVARGARLSLTARASQPAIRQAVARILDEGAFAEHAAAAKRIIATERTGDPAVEELEALVSARRS